MFLNAPDYIFYHSWKKKAVYHQMRTQYWKTPILVSGINPGKWNIIILSY